MTIDPKRLLAAAAAAALLMPAAAQARPGGNGHGNGHGNSNGKGHDKFDSPATRQAPASEAPAGDAPASETTAPAAVAPEADAPVADAPVVAPAPVAKLSPRADRKAPKGKLSLFRGRVISVDAVAGTVVVAVTGGNSRGRQFSGEEVTFDLAAAQLHGVETDGVRGISLGDVLAGDRVTVHARLSRIVRADAGSFAASRFVSHGRRAPVAVPEDVPADEEPVVVEAPPA